MTVIDRDELLAREGDERRSPLLDAALHAYLGHSIDELARALLSAKGLSAVGPRVLRAFASHPNSRTTLSGLAVRLGFSRRAVRQSVHGAGFERFEHFVTTGRAVVWRYLEAEGVPRSVIRVYLGIADLSDFRRACRRAGVQIPWRAPPRD